MKWQTIADAKVKDKEERRVCQHRQRAQARLRMVALGVRTPSATILRRACAR